MLTESSKERLEQDIVHLIKFITDGREFFFQKSGCSIKDPDDFLNHWQAKELFYGHPELIQLDLNIQLLYIKLSSYYELIGNGKARDLRKPRNAFAHDFTDLIFNKRLKYNFFLHKVSRNLNRVQYVFYAEDNKEVHMSTVMTVDLHEEINQFFRLVLAITDRNCD